MALLILLTFFIPIFADDEAEDVTAPPADAVAPLADTISGEEWILGLRDPRRDGVTKDKRKLVQFPTNSLYGDVGPCGSVHYNPDIFWNDNRYGFPNKKTQSGPQSGEIVDNYMTDTAACSLMAVIQEWHQLSCDVNDPAKNGCTLAYGDSGHRDVAQKTIVDVKGVKADAEVWVHGSHNDGNCIDMRPVTSGPFQNKPISPVDVGIYDREKTRQLLLLLQKHGGFGGYGKKRRDNMLFTDPVMTAQPYAKLHPEALQPNPNIMDWPFHANHFHVCFEDKKSCKKLVYNRRFCEPELYPGRESAQ